MRAARNLVPALLGILLCLAGCPSDADDAMDDATSDGGATLDSDAATRPMNDASTSGDADAGSGACEDGCDASSTPGHDGPFSGNGISGVVDGVEITFQNAVLVPNNSGDGRVILEAGPIDLPRKWRIFVPGTVGTHACDDDGNETVLQLIDGLNVVNSGIGSGAGSCTITVSTAAAGDGVYSGTFTAELETSAGLVTVTDGYFHYDPFAGSDSDEALDEGASGASFEIDGEQYTYTQSNALVFETYTGINAKPEPSTSPGFPLGVQLHTVPNELGTYACGEGPSWRAVNVWFYWKGDWYYAGNRQSSEVNGPAGSSCSITVTTVGSISGFDYVGTFAGTFSGTFVKSDGSASVVVENGTFRLSSTM